jgi:prephenate dehydratase
MSLRVAFQGAPGAFSHEAALALAPGAELVAFSTFGEVFGALERGEVDRAVVPIENAIAGQVPEVAQRMAQGGLEVVREASRPIEMALMALPGVEVAELRTVISHPMALKQCRRSLAALGLEAREVFDTAGAAGMVAEGGDRTLGALGSQAAAGLHGLAVLEPNMEDEGGNRTRFLKLRRCDP